MKKRRKVFSLILTVIILVGTFQLDFLKISASELADTSIIGDATNQNTENSSTSETQATETQATETEATETEAQTAENATSTDVSTQGTYTQKAIVLSMGSNETERNITWYSNDTNPGSLQLAQQSEMTGTEFPVDKSVTLTANIQATDDTGFYSNQLTMNSLQADTTYIYRLINGDTISSIYSFKTGSASEFHFLLAGDPQIGASGNSTNDTNGWDNTLTKAISTFPEPDFIVSAGDQVNTASDENQYAGFLEHDVLKSYPIATVIGNHDSTSAAYSQHFNNSNDGVYGATTAGTDYWYVYDNTLFLNINTNNLSTAEHKAFMEDAITKNPNVDWKVVVFHHSIYSVASHATQDDILQRREALAPIMKELDIDVVLMGHDHVYDRSYIMNGLTPIVENNADGSALSSVTNPEGVLYITVNSASGSKFYSIQNQTFEYVAVKSQENVPNISNVEVTKSSFKITTYRTNDMSVVDSFEIKHTVDVGTKPITTSTNIVTGVKNDTSTLNISEVAKYDSKVVNPDGGSAEIVEYNKDNSKYYVINGTTGYLDIVPREIYDASTETGSKAVGQSIDVKSKLSKLIPEFVYGDMTSVAVNTGNDYIAVGVQAAGINDDSLIVFLSYEGDIIKTVTAGKQVDMVTFTEDGSKLLAANEGEPREGYAEGITDPKGSVTVVDLSKGLDTAVASNVTFDSMDQDRKSLVDNGVIIKKNTMPSVDFEPEYIAVDSQNRYAYVTLQEANAIATLDLSTNTFISVKSLGYKDHSLQKNALDMKKDSQINIKTENVYGIYMPDGIDVYEADGKTYLVTANEGDSRDWNGYLNEVEVKIDGVKVVTFDTSDYDGVDPTKTYLFGGRSFSIYDADTMEQIYDSGSDFESITAKNLPAYFNSSNDKIAMDNRSGKKGPEPENVVIGKVGSNVYAFIGLERIGGIMVYNVTDVKNPIYVNYINSRDFSSDIAGDVSPEGLCFISKEDSISGIAEILSAFEVSGTVGIYQLVQNGETQPSDSPTPSLTPSPTATTSPTLTPCPTVTPNPTVTPVPTSVPIPASTATPTPVSTVKNISNLAIYLSKETYTYNGVSQLPEVTITDGSTVLKKGTDYTLFYQNNLEVGTGTVKITGMNKYTGTTTREFVINPKTSSIDINKSTTTSISLKWDKISGVSGYEILRTDYKSESFQLIQTTSNTSLIDENLKNATTYSYKLRTYQIAGGKTYYSDYSNVAITSTKPSSTSVKLKSNKNGVTITWSKVYGATGYQIYVANGKNATFKYQKDMVETNYKLTNLTAGKTYYIKVRAYKTVGNQTFYSEFSKVKTIKIK